MVRAQKPVHMFELTVTFDNGPEPLVTPGVLDILAHHGVASTFFVIGSKLAKPEARACAERAHSEGHWIGNPRVPADHGGRSYGAAGRFCQPSLGTG
jgi:peptidoglycan/xylan/chitin deacetylase (PgdA/CDA1 family)